MPRFRYRLVALALSCAFLPFAVQARVTRFVVEHRALFDGGKAWGSAGPYEKLTGTAYLEVNPKDPLDAVIANLDKAPRDAKGMVEFSTSFVILKPVDMRRGNHKIWYGINNRGYCNELIQHSFFAAGHDATGNGSERDAAAASPESCHFTTAAPENILLQKGFAIVDAGWMGDGPLALSGERLFPQLPIAKNSLGGAITGLDWWNFQTMEPVFSMRIATSAGTDWHAYETVSTDTSRAILTVRDREGAARAVISSDQWAFGRCPAGRASLEPSTVDVCIFDGFKPDKIYQLIYQAKNPIVMGLGYAVTRDIGSFLRYAMHDDVGNANPLAIGPRAPRIRREYASGISSTAFYLRDYLYLGFNEDEAHHRVFDGVIIFAAGANRLLDNYQFSHPTVMSLQNMGHDLPFQGPYTFAVSTDPVTGIRDGILKRPATDPYVIQVDEALDFWQWRASLNVVDGAGHSVPIPPKVRLYFQNGLGHSGGAGLLASSQPATACTYEQQGISPHEVNRAIVGILDDWVDKSIAPPPSNYPTIQNGQLVSLTQYRREFPKIPGVVPPNYLNQLESLDFGQQFDADGGLVTRFPPKVGRSYLILVPRPASDGPSAAGINTVWTRAPLGSNLGWNFIAGEPGQDLCNGTGTFIPFAKTKAERLADHDPRLSIEERYHSHAGFVSAVKRATDALVRERFMLKDDARRFVAAAQTSDVLK